MPFQTECTNCGQAFAAQDAMAGATMICPGCQRPFIVAPSYQDEEEFRNLTGTSSISSSLGSFLGALGIGGVMAVLVVVIIACVGVVGAYIFFGDGNNSSGLLPNFWADRSQQQGNSDTEASLYSDDDIDGDIEPTEDIGDDSVDDLDSDTFDDGTFGSFTYDPIDGDPCGTDANDGDAGDDDLSSDDIGNCGLCDPTDPCNDPCNDVSPPSVPWRVGLDPRKQAKAAFVGSVDLGPAVVGGAVFSDPSAGQVAVHMQTGIRSPRFVVRRYDLITGKPVGEFTVPPDTTLMDFRPDARVAVTRSPSGNSLDVWTCASTGDTKHLSWPAAGDSQNFYIGMAFFVSSSRLLILDQDQGEFQLVRLPELNTGYTMPWGNRPVSALSWNRKYLVTWSGGDRLEFYDTVSGSLAGESAPLPEPVDTFAGGVFSDDGKLFVATFGTGGGSMVSVWDMQTGELKQHFNTARLQGMHYWTGGRYVLIGNALVDLRSESQVWMYTAPPALQGSPNNQVWFVFPRGRTELSLTARSLPSPSVRATIENAGPNFIGQSELSFTRE